MCFFFLTFFSVGGADVYTKVDFHVFPLCTSSLNVLSDRKDIFETLLLAKKKILAVYSREGKAKGAIFLSIHCASSLNSHKSLFTKISHLAN